MSFAYNLLTMLPISGIKALTRSTRWLGLCALVAALPLAVRASTVAVDFGISLNGLTGAGQFTYDPAAVSTAGGLGPYADGADGLESFSLTYDGTTYTNTSANVLGGPTLSSIPLVNAAPAVFLPGNSTLQNGLQYEFFGLWVVSGSCTGTGGDYTCSDATILGLGRSTEAFLASDVTSADISYTGSDLVYNLGSAPGISEITGTITAEAVATPEPALLSLTTLGLAGLCFARRRKGIL